MKIKTLTTGLWALLALTLATLTVVQAADRSSAEEARAMLIQASAFLEKNDPEDAFEAFNDPDGPFVRDDLYVFVFDQNGNYMASGANPDLTGQQANNLRDAEGNPIVLKMLAQAQAQGTGQVDYKWLNRKTNEVEDKTSFIRKVGDYVVGVGYYH